MAVGMMQSRAAGGFVHVQAHTTLTLFAHVTWHPYVCRWARTLESVSGHKVLRQPTTPSAALPRRRGPSLLASLTRIRNPSYWQC